MEMIDIHTHVLPGIDDGAKNWDMCMQMLAKSAECGVRKIIATPHYLPWKKNAGGEKIQALCQEVKEKFYKNLGISMDIYPGNEIYYHVDMLDSIKKGKALTLAGSRYVLTEFSTEESSGVIQKAVQNLREAGYIPVIAHVERCRSLRKPDSLEKLQELGALFQMNVEVLELGLLSETGRWAKKMLQEERIHFLSSDMHNLEKRPPLSAERLQWTEKRLRQDYIEALLWSNGNRIIDGNQITV